MNNDWKLISLIVTIYGAIVAFLVNHIWKHPTNKSIADAVSANHPSKDSVVYKDVCDSEKKRLGDCIEGAIRRCDEHHAELKGYIKERFEAEEKQLGKLERLINTMSTK